LFRVQEVVSSNLTAPTIDPLRVRLPGRFAREARDFDPELPVTSPDRPGNRAEPDRHAHVAELADALL
jgi:hypothetical protein